MRKEKGITLVALVVTIIVLIILAGISINLVLGDNGIITIAQKAKENIELAKIEEETELNELYTQLEINGGSSDGTTYDAIAKITEFKTAIANAIEEAGGTKTDITAETSVFANNIKEIVKEVTKDATATEEDITEGKTAWINGEIVEGNKKENNVEIMGYSQEVTQSNKNEGYIVYRTNPYVFEEDYKYVIVSLVVKESGTSDGQMAYSTISQGTYLGGCKDWNNWKGCLSVMIYKDVPKDASLKVNNCGSYAITFIK